MRGVRDDKMLTVEHLEYLSRIGKKGGEVGGKSTSEAKVEAARKNVAKAQKARHKQAKYPQCAGYPSHRFGPDGRCYSPKCRKKYPRLRKT
jgi:hypothetical protein